MEEKPFLQKLEKVSGLSVLSNGKIRDSRGCCPIEAVCSRANPKDHESHRSFLVCAIVLNIGDALRDRIVRVADDRYMSEEIELRCAMADIVHASTHA